MTTLKDIAAKANVSVSTVSRVLGNRSSSVVISKSTRDRIIEIARQLGFRPNEAARRLQMRPQWATLALVFPRLWGMTAGTPFSGDFLRTILGGLGSEHGLSFVQYSAGKLESAYHSVCDVVSGMIVVSPAKSDLEFLSELPPADQQLVVVVNRTYPGITSVDGDNYRGAMMAITHLFERGRRRIGLITDAKPSSGSNVPLREQGYRDAIESYGIPYDPGIVLRVPTREPYPENAGPMRVAIQTLLSVTDPPDALFCVRDTFAFAAIRALSDLGRRVPEHMAVVGFDGADIIDYCDPTITSIRLPAEEMGRIATEIIVNNLSGGSPNSRNIVLPCELVPGGST